MNIVTLLNIPRISSQSSKHEKIAETKFACVYYDKINTTLLLQFFLISLTNVVDVSFFGKQLVKLR